MSPRAALALAAITAVCAGAALVRELAGGGAGALRAVSGALAAGAAAACLLAARRERGTPARGLAALGATLAVCALALLA